MPGRDVPWNYLRCSEHRSPLQHLVPRITGLADRGDSDRGLLADRAAVLAQTATGAQFGLDGRSLQGDGLAVTAGELHGL